MNDIFKVDNGLPISRSTVLDQLFGMGLMEFREAIKYENRTNHEFRLFNLLGDFKVSSL